METYRYRALTNQGEETAGIIEASDFDAAIQVLIGRDLREIQVFLVQPGSAEPKDSQAPVVLTAEEAGELSQHVAQVSTAEIPLAVGLRAAVDETTSSRVAVALGWIADQVEQGRTLEEALADSGRFLPPHISGLILAAQRTGNLGEALFELVELQQKTYSLRREIYGGYIYPLLVLALAMCVITGIVYHVTGMMGQMFDEFQLQLPLFSRVLFWWRDTGIWIAGWFLAFVAAFLFLFRILGGPVRWRRLLSAMPMLGPLWYWTGVAEWSGLLSVLLRHQVPLPEALRWAGRGTKDANIGDMSRRLADGVARGRLLSQMMYATPQLPCSIIPLIECGEASRELSQSFRMGQEMFDRRARMRAWLLQSVVPPLMFLFVGGVVAFVVMSMFLPLIDLVSMLS